MKNNTLIIVITALAIATLLAVLLWPAPEIKTDAVAQEAKAETVTSQPIYGDSFAPTADTTSTTSAAGNAQQALTTAGTSASGMTAKEQTLEVINEAMLTYSAESVPVLQTYLSNSDKEIRAEAIEALKQLDVPQAAAALREAARKTSNPEERQRLLEAAEFVDTPSLFGTP